jgi:signal transduction histidine kinase/ActR/RegA family two-component response regulator
MNINTSFKSMLISVPGRWFFLAFAFLFQAVFIVNTYPIWGERVFAVTMVPSIVSGLFFGKQIGAVGGLGASLNALCITYYLSPPGVDFTSIIGRGVFGIPLNLLVGLGFGVLHDSGAAFKRVGQENAEAQERQKKLEMQLQQSQKMEAIGTLAGGVAHDMNNILGIIMSSASLLGQSVPKGDARMDDIDNILSACRRGRDLTRNLLGFARKGTYVKDIIDLNEVVEQSKKLLGPIINKNIQIVTKLDGALYQIYGDRSQIEQTLMNICINAAEAISTAGTITISTRNCGNMDAAAMEEHGLYSGDYAVIEVRDTGCGIDAETLRHVFEPFFTTKQPGRGTGLGLSMAYGTVKNHGGGIEIKSSVGQGTALTIMLPALVSEQRVKVQRRISAIPPPAAGKNILLVDDEPLIRSSTKRLLQSLGYNVMIAESGEKAIQMYREAKGRISLVILDFVMPGMDGAETFVHLKELNPNAKIVISSGYSRDGNIETLLEKGAVGFLQKPFDVEQISEVLSTLPKTGTFPAVKINPF